MNIRHHAMVFHGEGVSGYLSFIYWLIDNLCCILEVFI